MDTLIRPLFSDMHTAAGIQLVTSFIIPNGLGIDQSDRSVYAYSTYPYTDDEGLFAGVANVMFSIGSKFIYCYLNHKNTNMNPSGALSKMIGFNFSYCIR